MADKGYGFPAGRKTTEQSRKVWLFGRFVEDEILPSYMGIMINHDFWIIVKSFPVLGGSSYLVVGTERGEITLVNHFFVGHYHSAYL